MAANLDKAFAARVAAFCLGELGGFVEAETALQFGLAFTKWDGKAVFTGRGGQKSPISRLDDGSIATAIPEMRYNRLTGTFSEIIALGHQSPLRLDMHDARNYGISAETGVEAPVVVYNRRAGAKNLVLWPLPKYHTLGSRKFVHPAPIDHIPFGEKLDIAVWRGTLSGRPNSVLAPEAKRRRFGADILRELNEPQSEESLWALHEELMGNTRYHLVLRYHMSKEMDVGLTLPKGLQFASETALLAPLCTRRKPVNWFFKSRYILSLAGNDTGSNFLMAANSNSVVLQETDGWELFYTGEFRPWEHFIPLSLGALDVEEKLAWARENPKRCREMVRAAQAVCAKFASPENRYIYLSEILATLREQR